MILSHFKTYFIAISTKIKGKKAITKWLKQGIWKIITLKMHNHSYINKI